MLKDIATPEPESKLPDLDYVGYEKSLEKILDGVTKDYWASYIDVGRHQLNVGKNYLWVSVTLLGTYVVMYEKFIAITSNNAVVILLGIISILCACFAFLVCLYAIPARKGYRSIPTEGWGEFSIEAHTLLIAENQKVYASFLTSLISKLDDSFAHNFRTNLHRAKSLRITSWLLIASVLCAMLVASLVIIEYSIKDRSAKEKTEMKAPSNDNTNSQTSIERKVLVPVPPKPADISTKKNTHAFDSAEKVKGVFITENYKGK